MLPGESFEPSAQTHQRCAAPVSTTAHRRVGIHGLPARLADLQSGRWFGRAALQKDHLGFTGYCCLEAELRVIGVLTCGNRISTRPVNQICYEAQPSRGNQGFVPEDEKTRRFSRPATLFSTSSILARRDLLRFDPASAAPAISPTFAIEVITPSRSRGLLT